MKKLTENLIQQRLKTCTTDLDKVLQINITGRELQDVSLLRKMTGVEILSLSVNRISSLIDFQNCKNLKELYLRNNNISDISQIYYLTHLPKLKLLMLSQNPCADDPFYRPTVIKNLQCLTELDGVPISPEERMKALKTGKDVVINAASFTSDNISDDGQIRRPLVQSSSDTEKQATETEIEVTGVHSNPEATTEPSINKSIGSFKLVEDFEHQVKPPNVCDICQEKEVKLINMREVKGMKYLNSIDRSSRQMMCKFCKAHVADSLSSLRIIPKNSNILSATLNLIKELDYSSLQVVQAELTSVLNTFEVDFVCHKKK